MAAGTANRPELLRPYFAEMLQAVAAVGTADAASLGCSGGVAVHLPGHFAPGGRANYGSMGQRTDASFVALHFVNYFKHTRNATFLREESFPFLRGVAAWWQCWLKKVPGASARTNASDYTWADAPDCTREYCSPDKTKSSTNPASAIAFIRFILQHLVDVADEGLVHPTPSELAAYRDILTHLAPLPTAKLPGSNTTLLLPQQAKGKRFSNATVFGAQGDNPLQFYGLYPGEMIGLGSDPGLLEAARETVALSEAWTQMNSFQETFPAAVRAGMNASMILDRMTALLVVRHFPAQFPPF